MGVTDRCMLAADARRDRESGLLGARKGRQRGREWNTEREKKRKKETRKLGTKRNIERDERESAARRTGRHKQIICVRNLRYPPPPFTSSVDKAKYTAEALSSQK